MQKSSGLGSKIDQAIEVMRNARRNGLADKKQLHNLAVEVAGGEMCVTKQADRAIWSAVYDATRNNVLLERDYRDDEEYR